MKRLSLFLFVLLLVGVVTGCGDSNNDGKAAESASPSASGAHSTPSQEEAVELIWWVVPDEPLQPVFDEYVSGFNALHPNVKIKKEIVPFDKIDERISIAANTKSLPDIQTGSPNWVMTYALKGFVQPLDDILDKADFDEALLNVHSVDGKLYLLPYSSNAIGLAVNRTMFKEAGAEELLPKSIDEPWTMEQFKKAASAVTDPGKQRYGYGLYAADTAGDQGTHAMLWGFGAKSFSDDNKQAVLNSPEGVEGLKFLLQLSEEGLTPPGVAGLKGGEVIGTMFPKGQIGMVMANAGSIATMEKQFAEGTYPKFDIDLVQYPTKDGVGSNTVLFPNAYWAWNTANDSKMKWAKEFVKFIGSKENMEKIAKAEGIIPTRKSLQSLIDPASIEGKAAKLFQYAGNIGIGVPGYAQTRAAFFPEIQAALLKKKTPEQALKDWTKKANDIIAQNSK